VVYNKFWGKSIVCSLRQSYSRVTILKIVVGIFYQIIINSEKNRRIEKFPLPLSSIVDKFDCLQPQKKMLKRSRSLWLRLLFKTNFIQQSNRFRKNFVA